MSHQPNKPHADSEEREARIQAIRQRLTPLLEQAAQDMAGELADLPEHQLFGAIELALRKPGLQLAADAHQAALDTRQKKTATTDPASFALPATRMPNSSTT